MSTLTEAILKATQLIFEGNSELLDIILLSFKVSLSAVFFSILIGLPIALLMTVYNFFGKKLMHILIDTLMAFPPVVVGLTVYLLLSQAGPLGVFGLLYSPKAMIIAQTLLITPIIIALTIPHLQKNWMRLRDQLLMLGYRPIQSFSILLYESRIAMVTIVLAGFGRAIAEIGAVMIVGGNIESHTRVMTTAIAMETQKGNLSLAMALGLILIVSALCINAIIHWFKFRLSGS